MTAVSVKLRGRLPDGKANGVLPLARDLYTDAGTRILVALVAPVAIGENLETGNLAVTLGIEAAEITDTAEAREFLRRLTAERTGELELPFGVDADTGEIIGNVLRDGAGVLDEAAAAAIAGKAKRGRK